jgi:hypothetical protein
MMNDIIEATILNVKFKGEDLLFPRIPMILTDLQYPVRLAFAMTINKAQGNSMLILLTRLKTFRLIRVHTRKKNKKYCIFKALQ